MRNVTNKELSTFKILPFDLYNESGSKILSAGEVLTPGNLIMLKNHVKIYTEEFCNDITKNEDNGAVKGDIKKLTNFSFDTLDATEFETVINKDNQLKMETQVKIKYLYRITMDLFIQGYYEEGLLKLNNLVNILITDIFKQLSRTKKGSQIRFLGEYEICHPLNVALVSGLIARKLDYSNIDVEYVLLAGMSLPSVLFLLFFSCVLRL